MTAAFDLPPRAVLFDWDDTLVDNWSAITDALNSTFAAYDMARISIDEAKRQATRSMRDRFPVIFGAEWQRARDLFLATFEAHHLDQLTIKPGAVSLLDLLRDLRIPVAVVSNKSGSFLRAEADHLRWTERFVSVIGAGDATADKPDPAVVTLALAGAKIAGEEVDDRIWLVGDSDVDMACAAATGCTGIRINWNGQLGDVAEGQKRTVTTLDELRTLVSASRGAI